MNGRFASYHPSVSFLYFAVVIVTGMFSMRPVFLAMSFCCAFLYSLVLRGEGASPPGLRYILPVFVLTALINPLFVHRGVTVLFYISGHAVTLEAALYGAAAGAMLTSVVMWCGCYHAVITSDKFIYLFGRAAPALSLSLSVCLRFIPTLRARYSEIALGQRSLGRGPEGRGLAGRVRFFARVTSVLVSWSMENAMDTAASMRARGYGLKGRTSFGLFVFTRRDGAMLALVSALAAVVVWGCAAGENSINWYPFIALPPVTARTFAVCGAYLALLLIPAAADIAGELKWKYSLSRI